MFALTHSRFNIIKRVERLVEKASKDGSAIDVYKFSFQKQLCLTSQLLGQVRIHLPNAVATRVQAF